MKRLLHWTALASLALLTLPSFFFLAGRMCLETVKTLMLIATIVWFVGALPQIWNKEEQNKS